MLLAKIPTIYPQMLVECQDTERKLRVVSIGIGMNSFTLNKTRNGVPSHVRLICFFFQKLKPRLVSVYNN